jgi:hypothetical protein
MRALNGEVAEWSKAHAWKVCIRQRIEGSNPSLTAIYEMGPIGPIFVFRGECMSRSGRIIALIVAIAMFAFSAWMYSRTGDWVAAIFALGSVAYGVYFFSSLSDSDS